MTYHTFPFGKYKGFDLYELPITYVVYALESFSLPDELRLDLQNILAEKLDLPLNTNSQTIGERTILSVHKKMALLFHPDRGGDDNSMKAINAYKDALLESLNRAI